MDNTIDLDTKLTLYIILNVLSIVKGYKALISSYKCQTYHKNVCRCPSFFPQYILKANKNNKLFRRNKHILYIFQIMQENTVQK